MTMRLALKSVTFHVRNLRTRLPFRYGIVTHLEPMARPEDWSFDSVEAST